MKFLFWCIVALNLGDFWLTSLILNKGGEELNPWVNYCIELWGNVGILLAKAPPLIALGIIVYFFLDSLSDKWLTGLHNVLILLIVAFVALNLYSLGLYTMIINK